MADNVDINVLKEVSDNLDYINEDIAKGIADAKTILDSSNFKINEVEPSEMPCKLCEFTEKIKKLSEHVDKFQSYSQYIKSIGQNYLNGLSNKIANPIKNKLTLLTLKIKKVILWIRLELVKIKRNLLLLAAQGKIAPVLQAIFGALLIAIQLIFAAITAIIKIIEAILALIPFLFALDPEGMSFFLTPKSFKTTKMQILNMNNSVERVLPSPVITAINQILNVPIYTMGANKKIAIAASVSQSAIAALDENADSGIVIVEADISYAVKEVLLTAINVLLAVLPLIEPLPKYERLPMWKNLGFFLWLLTGWCPAGRKSFGLPGI